MNNPSAKDRRYDRQLRLWAADGQRALEETWVVLVNRGPGALGIETLKNLILPGVGRFTILDDHTVEDSDLGINFFVTQDDLGKPRAEVTARLLGELNPEVQGGYSIESLSVFVRSEPTVLRNSLFIIAGPLPPAELRAYNTLARENGIPLVQIQSIGFYGQLALSLPHYFPIVDSHPEVNSITDLRILDPWPELQKFVQEQTSNIDGLSDDDHGHVPYILILLHYVQEWKSQHNGSPPSTYAEKTQFRDLIRSKIRTSTPEGGEENFEEAVAAVLKALNPPCLPSTVRDVFDNVDGVLEASRTQPSEGPPDLSYLSLHGQAETHFWNITKAVRAFYQKHGVLPLSGVVPDMKARTGDYVALQKIYRQKAREDAAEVLRGVKDLDKGRPSTPEDDALLEKEVTAYCRTAMAVRVIYGKSLHIVSSDCPGEPNQFTKADLLSIYQDMQFNPDNLFHIVPCFQTWQLRYVSKSGDIADTALLQELARLQQSWSAALGEEDLDEEVWMQFKTRVLKSYAEMERAGEAELHNIAAVLGGMAAQEVIKVITRQYIPIDNVVILDGIQSRTQVFRI